MWEQPPESLLAAPGLLPLATLAQTNSPQQLLEQVVAQVNMIEEPAQQQSIAACVQLVARLIFDAKLLQQLFRRDIMRESVIYQEILQEGREEGRQAQLKLVLRLLQRQFQELSPIVQTRIEALSLAQLTNLSEASLDFESEINLINWLNQAEP